jgi:hypothetical protein
MESPAVMAVLGHSGSHAPQLMHSATIFIAIEVNSSRRDPGRTQTLREGNPTEG